MAKKRKPKKTPRTRSKPREKEQHNTREESHSERIFSKISAKIGKILSVVIGGLGLLVLVSYYKPISVSPNEPLRPTDPFSAPFTLSNDWYTPIRDIRYSCRINRVTYQYGLSISNAEIPGWRRSRTRMGYREQADFFCPYIEAFKVENYGEITRAEMSITIHFRVQFLPWQREEQFVFRGAKDANGKWRWLRSPILEIK